MAHHYNDLDAFVADLPRLAERAREKLSTQPPGVFGLCTTQGRNVTVRLLEGGRFELAGSAPDEAYDCALVADERDLLAIINGEQNPVTAILFGKIKVKGDKLRLLALARLL